MELGANCIERVSFKGQSRDSRSEAEKTKGKVSPTIDWIHHFYVCRIEAQVVPPSHSWLRPESRSQGRATGPFPPHWY